MNYDAIHRIPWMHGSFWVFVAIIIFAVLAGRQIAAYVTGMLDARTRQVQEALDEAARLRAEAEAMLADAKAAQEQAKEDARTMIENAQIVAARLASDLAADARSAAKWRERMALERIAAAEASAVHEVRAAAIDIATAASEAVLREHFSAEADAAMVDAGIAGVPPALRSVI
jgi:F-type H+-transporting ATPase subunit b